MECQAILNTIIDFLPKRIRKNRLIKCCIVRQPVEIVIASIVFCWFYSNPSVLCLIPIYIGTICFFKLPWFFKSATRLLEIVTATLIFLEICNLKKNYSKDFKFCRKKYAELRNCELL